MEILSLTKKHHAEWNRFCLKSNDAWFWHTTDWLEYILNLKPKLKSKNLSFFVCKQNQIVAIVPLTMEVSKENFYEFSFAGEKNPGPALSNSLKSKQRKKVYEFIFKEIDRIAVRNKVIRTSFKLTPLAPTFLKKPYPPNYLMQYGYLDNSLNTQLVDLKKSREVLWQSLRRNHRRNIGKAKKILKIKSYTSKNITKDIFTAYKKTHHQAAGRKTRPDKTFWLMFNWIKKALAFLVTAELKGKPVGFEYYLVYKNNVYGSSAANNPKYNQIPIRHLIEWEAILWMKKQGFSFYEIGLQQYGVLPYDFPDKKQLTISHFKKGFGGFTSPLFMGEKFYSKKYYQKIASKREKKFLPLYFAVTLV